MRLKHQAQIKQGVWIGVDTGLQARSNLREVVWGWIAIARPAPVITAIEGIQVDAAFGESPHGGLGQCDTRGISQVESTDPLQVGVDWFVVQK